MAGDPLGPCLPTDKQKWKYDIFAWILGSSPRMTAVC